MFTTFLAVFGICLFIVILLLVIYCVLRVSSIRSHQHEVWDRWPTCENGSVDPEDGPKISINYKKILGRTYEPYQIALLQQIEALLPITAEEDVETIFSKVLEAYKEIGYNVEDAGNIIKQFRKGNHPSVKSELTNAYV